MVPAVSLVIALSCKHIHFYPEVWIVNICAWWSLQDCTREQNGNIHPDFEKLAPSFIFSKLSSKLLQVSRTNNSDCCKKSTVKFFFKEKHMNTSCNSKCAYLWVLLMHIGRSWFKCHLIPSCQKNKEALSWPFIFFLPVSLLLT